MRNSPGHDGTGAEAWPQRRSTRLRHYDYASAGAYFITVCAATGAPPLCTIRDAASDVTPAGRIVAEEWLHTSRIRPQVVLDAYVIMPNHWHGVLFIEGPEQGMTPKMPGGRVAPSQTIGAIIRGVKGASTSRIHALPGMSARPIWQRNFYDHIIRNDADLQRIREYIITNPLRWTEDRFYFSPGSVRADSRE